MKKEMKKENVFRVGDKLWCPHMENVEVVGLGEGECFVESLDGGSEWVSNHLLSFTKYPINANQVRPFEPKDGDILFHKETDTHHESISIYKNKHRSYCMWINITDELEFNPIIGSGYHNYHISEATEDQKQLLFDRLARDGNRWNPETKQLEDRNEPKVGDDVIVWNEPMNQDASIVKMTVHSAFIWDRIVKWDGTKEQFDRIRKGGEE